VALEKKLANFQNALQRLQEAYNKTVAHQKDDEYTFYRDSTIQRFEFTLEIAWKSIKNYLLVQDGIECRSPKACMREFFSAGHISDRSTQKLLMMVDDRNLSTHTYHESVADEIFSHIGDYISLLKSILYYMKQ
jgi:nucleotidyltransferase substrate binding protein (TIGR01987 family)